MSEHNVHRQHRERVKSRFLAEGMDHMPPHNALELLLRSWKNFNQGAERYLDLVAQTDTQGYVGAVEAAGLRNMLEPKSLAELTEGLKGYLAQEICQAAPLLGAAA